MVQKLLDANRFGQAPSWEDLGLSNTDKVLCEAMASTCENVRGLVGRDKSVEVSKGNPLSLNSDPLHLKDVPTINVQQLDSLKVEDAEVLERWRRVSRWITVAPKDIHRGRTVEARMTADEVALMVALGHAELTSEGKVKSTVNVFPHAEPFKKRRRLIKHTKAFNDFFGKEVLEKITLLHGRSLTDSVHDGTFAVCMDYSAWFDQIELADEVRDYNCFCHEGKWYRLTRLAMGMRTAVDVAHTATQLIASFSVADGVRCDVYIDNIRFLGNSRQDVIKAAATFITRSRAVNATINEVPDLEEDSMVAAERLVASEGDFLGVHFDYVNKTVKVTEKTITKLRTMREVLVNGTPSHRNFLALFGLLFFIQQVTRAHAASHYYSLKEYSETARRLQGNPSLLETPYRCSPSRMHGILQWVDSALRNEASVVRQERKPGEARYVLVTDASKRGWGALLYDQLTGQVFTQHCKWDQRWSGRQWSSWAESEAIAQALLAFFPDGLSDAVDILSDSTAAVGAFTKGYSLKYSVNQSVGKVEEDFRGR